jgi:hypothetical protein
LHKPSTFLVDLSWEEMAGCSPRAANPPGPAYN